MRVMKSLDEFNIINILLIQILQITNEIENDLSNLINVWNSIKNNAMNSIAPSLIHQESDIIKRSIRDMYDDNTQNIIVEGNDGY